MKAKEMKEKSSEELKKILQEKRSILCQLRFGVKARQVKNHQQLKETKKDIARILTLLENESAEVSKKQASAKN
jgi:large subunit ribosomal protein L29